MKLDAKYIVIAILIIGLLVGVILHIRKINNIKKEIVNTEVNELRKLTPLIDTLRGDLVVTLDAINKSEEQIEFLKSGMKDLKVDTISLEEAVKIIKDKKYENELLDAMGNPVGTKF